MPDIAPHADKFGDHQFKRVECRGRAEVDAVFNLTSVFFIYESTEQSIPDNQNASKVGIDLFGVAAMVHPMVARCIKDPFKPAWHPPYGFGVHKKLKKQIQFQSNNGVL